MENLAEELIAIGSNVSDDLVFWGALPFPMTPSNMLFVLVPVAQI